MIHYLIHIQLAASERCRRQRKTGENMHVLLRGDKDNRTLSSVQKKHGKVGNNIRSAHTSATEERH
eukprot:10407803-Ditylum_brightwellii.AAC.1